MSRVLVVLGALIGALFSLALSTGTAVAAAPPVELTYAYDSHGDPVALTNTTTERGPPETYDHPTAYDADGLRLVGGSARPDGPTTPAAYGYDGLARLVQIAPRTEDVEGQVGRSVEGSAVLLRSDDAANTGRRAFDLHPRVAGQLNDPRLGALKGKLTPDDLQELAHNPSATYLMDNATGHINVVQEIDGVILRITTPRDAFKIISVGRMRPSQVPNGIESGRFVDIGPGG